VPTSHLATTQRKNFSFFIGQQKAVLSAYAKAKGWPYIVSWAHRITGILLVLYLWFHIYTLSFLTQPAAYDSKMRVLQIFIFVLLEWLLAIPVIFHALNGGRLILYESFGIRKNEILIRWVLVLSAAYTLLLGLMFLLKSQYATPIFYWSTTLALCIAVVYPVFSKIRHTENLWTWKLQRITGAFLLVVIPAHLLFMHLNVSMGHEADIVIARMQNFFIKIIDTAILVSALYHGGYGILAVAKDYIKSKTLQNIFAGLIVLIMILFGWCGTKLTFTV
jgi:succinate dehydrogenase cytochrome b556 subunit/succinate dehydrogenase hydrophobic membrane anchor protein